MMAGQPEQLELTFDDEPNVVEDVPIQIIALPVVPKHPMANCSGCPLYEVGAYVPSTFPVKTCSTDNQLAVVGEAPGENEVHKGRPFIGPSGELLNKTLELFQLERREMLITNASACAYPKGRGPGKFDKLPPKAVEHCRPRLLHELEATGVRTAVAMGAHATRSLLKTKEGISLVRAGGPKLSDYVSGLRVVPTFHPAYALRSHGAWAFIRDDLRKINDDIWDIWPGVNKRVVQTEKDAAQEIVNMWNSDKQPIVCDTESGADKDETFGGGIKEILCIGIWDEQRWEAVIFPRSVFTDRVRRLMGKLFTRNGLDGQHLKYDIGRVLNSFLGVDGLLDIQARGDRMLQKYVLCETSGVHGLDFMSREHLGSPLWKHLSDENMKANQAKARNEAKARKEKIGDRFKGIDYGMIDNDVLWKYNSYDVGNTRFLRDYFDPQIDAVPGLRKLYEYLLEATQMLIHVEQRGIGIDEAYNAQLEGELRQQLGELCFETGLDKFNPRSPLQVKSFLDTLGYSGADTQKGTLTNFLGDLGYTVKESQKGAGISIVNDSGADSTRPEVVEFCRTLLEHRGASKLLNTYVLGLRKVIVDGSIHPDFSLLSTTGRTKGKAPNPQNLPRQQCPNLRKQFRARQGKTYISCDYGQNELRVMAVIAKDEGLRELFTNTEIYIFDQIALRIFGAEVFNAWDAAKKKDIHGSLTKPLAYGSAYGRGPSAIADSFGISLARAKKIQGEFFSMIPGVIKYQQQVKETATGCGDLVTPFGRHRRFRLVTNENYHEICNEAMAFEPQSIASDICVTAAIRLDRMGIPIVNLVHDQIITEPDIKEAEECARLQRKVMIDTAEEFADGFIPWKVDVEIGDTYGTFEKYKLTS